MGILSQLTQKSQTWAWLQTDIRLKRESHEDPRAALDHCSANISTKAVSASHLDEQTRRPFKAVNRTLFYSVNCFFRFCCCCRVLIFFFFFSLFVLGCLGQGQWSIWNFTFLANWESSLPHFYDIGRTYEALGLDSSSSCLRGPGGADRSKWMLEGWIPGENPVLVEQKSIKSELESNTVLVLEGTLS